MVAIGKVQEKPVPAAYKVGVSAYKLERKDPGPTGKSGK
jgi:hypothetical protein